LVPGSLKNSLTVFRAESRKAVGGGGSNWGTSMTGGLRGGGGEQKNGKTKAVGVGPIGDSWGEDNYREVKKSRYSWSIDLD